MSDLFSTGLSGLSIARTALATTAHNTANVYTEGYSRQRVIVETNPALGTSRGFIGTGARVTSVQRSYDGFLNAQLSQADSSAASLDAYSTQVGRLDDLLADRTSGLSAMMQNFFAGVQGVADTPADPAARQQMLSSAETLAGKFRSVDSYLNDLNASVNDQIAGSVEHINAIASQVAVLNKQISQLSAAAGGQPPNDLLDMRDKLVSDLSKIVGVTVVQQDGGMYNLFVGSGHTLVLGDTVSTIVAQKSAADPTRMALAVQDPGGGTMELRDADVTGGTLGGLMAFRTQSLTATQNSIGRLAITMAAAFNAQHEAGVDLQGATGGPFFGVAAQQVFSNHNNTAGGLTLGASITNAGALTTSDYSVDIVDNSGTLAFVVTRLSDGQQVPVTPSGADPATFTDITFDGVTVTNQGGTAAAGDSFLVQPTRYGARDVAVQIVDPAKIAAAVPPVTAATASAAGTISQPVFDASYRTSPLGGPVAIAYDGTNLTGFPGTQPVTVIAGGTSTTYAAGTAVPYTSGATISFGGMAFTISGAAAGDTFTLTPRPSGVSDGSNALALAALQRQNVVGSGSATLSGAYSQLVAEVGNRAQEVQIAYTSQTSLAGQVRTSQQAVSGVNQDEETANLLQYQQMYQANAKVIQAASTMFDTILGLR